MAVDVTDRFSDRASDYAAHRPAYGDDALRFVLEGLGPRPRVADLGAGTGISSHLLASHGAEVFAVEPNAAMRARIAAGSGVRPVEGRAEATGLFAGSVDLVTAFQSFHWFAGDEALAEIARVTRPGGRAALVVNERDERDAFTAAFGEIVRRYATDDTEERRRTSVEVFARLPGVVRRRVFDNGQTLGREGLWGRAASTSYLPREGAGAGALRAELDAIFDRFAGDDEHVRLALVTLVVRVDRAGG